MNSAIIYVHSHNVDRLVKEAAKVYDASLSSVELYSKLSAAKLVAARTKEIFVELSLSHGAAQKLAVLAQALAVSHRNTATYYNVLAGEFGEIVDRVANLSGIKVPR